MNDSTSIHNEAPIKLLLRATMKRPQTDLFKEVVKRTKNNIKREASLYKKHCQEFGVPASAEKDEEDAAAAALEADNSAARPVFVMLEELIRQKSPLIVITSAMAEAEADYEHKIHFTPTNISKALAYAAIEPRVKLWPHQEEALRFAASREADEAGIGCRGLMLCDDMGLGKTLETLAFILEDTQRRYKETGHRFNGVSLIVMPKMVIETWISEIEQSFPPNTLHYIKMVGDHTQPPGILYIESCVDIIFTTYSVISLAYKALRERWEKTDAAMATTVDTREMETEIDEIELVNHRYSVLFDLYYTRVVADEAQGMVNRNTLAFAAMKSVKARAKWGNTGTPIQNSHNDVYACLDFIGVPGISEKQCLTEEDGRSLKVILDKVMLRRLKSDITESIASSSLSLLSSGVCMTPFNKIDQKTEIIDFETQQERILYLLYATHSLTKSRRQHARATASRGEKNMNITSIIQFMRQACIDFRIIKKVILPNGMLTMQAEETESIIRSKPTTFNEKLFYPDSQQFTHIDKDNEDLEKCAFRLNHRTSFHYNTDAVYTWDPYSVRDSLVDPNGDELSRYLYETIYTMLCKTRKDERRDLSLAEVTDELTGIVSGDDDNDESHSADTLLLNKQIEAMYVHIMARALPIYATKPRRILRYIKEEISDPTDKVIIFSDSVMFLKLMVEYLREQAIQSCLVTGDSAKNGVNEAQLRRFQTDPDIRCLLMSLKVGNVGLNMQCANHIIFVSPWWNPYIEMQAENRAQRIGQRKEVHIRHFIIKDTIEEYILNLHKYKKSISQNLIEQKMQDEEDEVTRAMDDETTRARLFDFRIKVIREKKDSIVSKY